MLCDNADSWWHHIKGRQERQLPSPYFYLLKKFSFCSKICFQKYTKVLTANPHSEEIYGKIEIFSICDLLCLKFQLSVGKLLLPAPSYF